MLTALSEDDVAALRGAVRSGLEAPRQSASKWSEVYAWFGQWAQLTEDDLRTSLLAKAANLSNRVGKDNAWTNPEVLILVMDPEGEVGLDRARREVRDYVRTFSARLDATSHLRVVLYFYGDDLVAIDKLRFVPFVPVDAHEPADLSAAEGGETIAS